MKKHVAGLQHRCCIAWDTAVKQELSTKRLFQMFQACSWISTNWLPRKQFLHHKAEQLKHRPNLSVFGSPQNAAHISTAVFYTRSAMLWNLLLYTTWVYAWCLTCLYTCSQNDQTAGQCKHKRDPQDTRACMFWYLPKKKDRIVFEEVNYHWSPRGSFSTFCIKADSTCQASEGECVRMWGNPLLETSFKAAWTSLEIPHVYGTKMLRTDSRTEIPQATRTGLVRSPSCSPISWRWKPLAMIASMASHKSFTTWHSTLTQLIAKHLALPKLNNVDWKGDEFTCKLTYAYHKLILQKYTEMNYCIIVALPSYTSLNLLELGQNPRFVAWKESDYSLGPLWLIAISAISAIKRRPGMVCSFAGVIFLWLCVNPALGRIWMDLAWLLMWCAVVFYAFFFHWYSRWDETCVNVALIRSTFPHSFGATSSLPMSNALHFGLCWPGADKHIEHLQLQPANHTNKSFH